MNNPNEPQSNANEPNDSPIDGANNAYQTPQARSTVKNSFENEFHENATTANIIYILYLINIVVPFLGLIGVIMAYVKKSESPEWLQTHFQFQIRTFWIGLLYIFIGVITSWILIGYFILLFVVVWIIVRCAKGMGKLSNKQAIDEPTSWLF